MQSKGLRHPLEIRLPTFSQLTLALLSQNRVTQLPVGIISCKMLTFSVIISHRNKFINGAVRDWLGLEAEDSGRRNPVIGRFLLAILLRAMTGVWN